GEGDGQPEDDHGGPRPLAARGADRRVARAVLADARAPEERGDRGPRDEVDRGAHEEEALAQVASLLADELRLGGRDLRQLLEVGPRVEDVERAVPAHPGDREEEHPRPAQVLHQRLGGAAHGHAPSGAR
ncbi:MAG: hypothetical protein ACK559_21555, partial [bacterium]